MAVPLPGNPRRNKRRNALILPTESVRERDLPQPPKPPWVQYQERMLGDNPFADHWIEPQHLGLLFSTIPEEIILGLNEWMNFGFTVQGKPLYGPAPEIGQRSHEVARRLEELAHDSARRERNGVSDPLFHLFALGAAANAFDRLQEEKGGDPRWVNTIIAYYFDGKRTYELHETAGVGSDESVRYLVDTAVKKIGTYLPKQNEPFPHRPDLAPLMMPLDKGQLFTDDRLPSRNSRGRKRSADANSRSHAL